jgi:hypothetical protein
MRDWPTGWALASQASKTGSTPVSRSSSERAHGNAPLFCLFQQTPLPSFKIKAIHNDRIVYQAYCISCQRNYRQAHYRANREVYLKRKCERDQRIRRMAEKAEARPCADCGIQYQPWQMDFDHIEDNKVMRVAELVRRKVSIRKLREEIAKCEVVCANCHRNRTHNRRMAEKESL